MSLLHRVLVVLLLPLVQSASAGWPEDHEHVLLMTDATGDVEVQTAYGNVPDAGGLYDHADIEAAWIAEVDDRLLAVGVDLLAWDVAEGVPSLRGVYVYAGFGEREYRFRLPTVVEGSGNLATRSGQGDPWSSVASLQAEVDADRGAAYVLVPKALVEDEQGRPLRFDASLGSVHAEVEAGAILVTTDPVAYDRAEPGSMELPFTMIQGEATLADWSLASPVPARFSNGETTTFVFPLIIDHVGSEEGALELTARSSSPSVHATVPQLVRAEPGQSLELPVIVSMEFVHQHGESATVLVDAVDSEHPDETATFAFEIHWLEVPQPAGHHPRLWFHSAPASGMLPGQGVQEVWMSAVQDSLRTDATDEPVGEQGSPSWRFFLQPDLAVGLDFDLDRTGTFSTTIESDGPISEAVIQAVLWHCDPTSSAGADPGALGCSRGSWWGLAQGQSAPMDIPLGGASTFEFDLDIEVRADLVPQVDGARMRLDLDLSPGPTQNPVPFVTEARLLVAETEMGLPLLEYQDPIDAGFESIGSLALRAAGPFERVVNPGDVIVYPFAVVNQGDAVRTVVLGVEGFNREWASWDASRLDLAPGEEKRALLGVHVPVETPAGVRAELMATVQDEAEPHIVALSRVRAVVVDSPDVADESHLLNGRGREAPALSPIVLILGLVVWIRRNRNRG